MTHSLPIHTKPYIWESGLVRLGKLNSAEFSIDFSPQACTRATSSERPLEWSLGSGNSLWALCGPSSSMALQCQPLPAFKKGQSGSHCDW